MTRLGAVLALALAVPAFATVGKIVKLDGKATRAPKEGAAVALAVGTGIELGDTLEVAPGGALKLELSDGSVIMLDEKSKLLINEADFEGQDRKGFSAFLEAGKLWTKVKKAIGGAKYEVTTERAVAGVRGTIFRIDADTLVKAAKGKSKGRRASVVRVTEGLVNVRPSQTVIDQSKAAAPKQPKKGGPRVQVAGPQEITVDEWEKKFVELQKDQQIVVGVDLWEQAEIDAAARADKFSKWIDSNQ